MDRMVKLIVTMDGRNDSSQVSIKDTNILFDEFREILDSEHIKETFDANFKTVEKYWNSITIDVWYQNGPNAKVETIDSVRFINNYGEISYCEATPVSNTFDNFVPEKHPMMRIREYIHKLTQRANQKFISIIPKEGGNNA